MIVDPFFLAILAVAVVGAEAGTGSGFGADEVIQLVNYGVLGIIVVGAATGFVEFKPSVSRLVRDNDRQHSQIESLVKTYEERVIPVLVSANEMLARLAEEERRRKERRDWEREQAERQTGTAWRRTGDPGGMGRPQERGERGDPDGGEREDA